MPAKILQKTRDYASLGLWNITESTDELISLAGLGAQEFALYNTFSNDTRRKHWLSYRALVKQMLDGRQFNLVYDTYGKLHPDDGSFHLSVSHSGDYSAAIVNQQTSVGIDVEKMTPRILKIADRFMGPAELAGIPSNCLTEYYYVYWGAKEALFKYYAKGSLEFRTQLQILPFKLSETGTVTGSILTDTFSETLTLKYELFENYILVHTENL
jgi:4'-phosphopantetheinyl transferase